jgi:hypothetical protein
MKPAPEQLVRLSTVSAIMVSCLATVTQVQHNLLKTL